MHQKKSPAGGGFRAGRRGFASFLGDLHGAGDGLQVRLDAGDLGANRLADLLQLGVKTGEIGRERRPL
jgi:hypothetical protein